MSIGCHVTGNIGKDGKLSDASGTPVVNFSVATTRMMKGEKVTDWVNVAFFGKRAASVAPYLTKGKTVSVRGTVYVREYQKADKSPGVSIECNADDVELHGGGKSDAGSSEGGDRIPF